MAMLEVKNLLGMKLKKDVILILNCKNIQLLQKKLEECLK